MRAVIPLTLAAMAAAGICLYLAAADAPPKQPSTIDDRPPPSLVFEPNVGQTDPRVRFVSRGPGHALFLTDQGAVLRVSPPAAGGRAGLARAAGAVVTMTLAGAATPTEVAGHAPLPGANHYLIGRDPSGWHRDVPRYGEVRYTGVYPGVDTVWYGNEGELEYDFVVAPGADPGQIAMRFDGARDIAIDATGNLVLDTAAGPVVQKRPIAYQVVDGARRTVDAAYRVLADGAIGFATGAFDAALPLVIDPVLGYSTYLGGDGQDESAEMAVDDAGNTWISGLTNSVEFPWDMGNDSEFSGGAFDAYVCRFTANGGIPTCAYIGGSGEDGAWGLAIGPDGKAYVSGYTFSADFPTVDPAQATPGGHADAFLLRINATADGLDFSTYYGGNDFENARGLHVDNHGRAYITGETWSHGNTLPVTAGAYQTTDTAGADVFVAKFAADGTLEASTYLGGSGDDLGRGITTDLGGNVFLTGKTVSADFPLESPLLPPGGGGDAFLSVLDGTLAGLLLSTPVGGSAEDWGYSVVVDHMDRLTLAGFTYSADFPVHQAAQPTHGGDMDGFLMRLDLGAGIGFSTFMGGSDLDDLRHIAVDPAGNTYWLGYTQSGNFPLKHQLAALDGQDAVLAKFDPTGKLLLSTPLGGGNWEIGTGVGLDFDGNVHVAGFTTSVDMPLAGAFQQVPGSAESDDGLALASSDLFVSRFTEPALDQWRGDFDGDGTDDILMRNNATGANTIWRSGNSRTTQRMTRILDLHWRIVGVGDFDGDGASDVFWRHAATGGNAIWSGALSNAQLPVDNVTNTNWEVQAVADFDADGKDDVVWHDPTTGASSLWYSANPDSATNLVTITNLAWDIVGAGDLDGDGQADLVWRVERTGQNAVWRSGDHGDQLDIARVAGAWKVAGIADYHGDGTADLLWRHLQTGRNVLWDGGNREASTNVTPVPGQAWQVAGSGDYDGDGDADILWRHAQTGANSIWRSANSKTRKVVSFLRNPDWSIKS